MRLRNFYKDRQDEQDILKITGGQAVGYAEA